MRTLLLAAVAASALFAGSAAMADEFSGQAAAANQNGINAYLDQQAVNAQQADPTAPNSLRSHGRP